MQHTTDGYYTLTSLASGRCAESRLGTRFLNTPLQPGTPITAQTCDPRNRLQRWELTKTGGQITLVNAVTRMVAVFATGGLVQQVPDVYRAAALTLAPALRVTAAVDRQTVVPGGTTTLTVTVGNTTDQSATGVTVTPTVPSGWTVAPGSRTAGTIPAGGSWTAATGEAMGGTLTRLTGAESLDPARGLVLAGARDGALFEPAAPISGGTVQRSFLIETAYTPSATQNSLATIVAIGGT